MRKAILIFVLLTLVITTIITACSKLIEEQEVTFDQLFSDPSKYNNKEVTIVGFYFKGFEVNVLSEKLEYSGMVEGHLIPKGRMIGVSGVLPTEVYNGLNQQQKMGPVERYGKVRMTGRFEYGGQYAVGAPDKQITPTVTVLIP